MTNYEKIKNMSVEEMATRIKKFSANKCSVCAYYPYCHEKQECLDGIVDWLNEEMSE